MMRISRLWGMHYYYPVRSFSKPFLIFLRMMTHLFTGNWISIEVVMLMNFTTAAPNGAPIAAAIPAWMTDGTQSCKKYTPITMTAYIIPLYSTLLFALKVVFR